VSLRVVGDRVSLQVGDDGAGFATTRVADHLGQDHFGLASMRQQVEMAGGVWQVRSRPGQGTTVTATLPIAGAGRAASRRTGPGRSDNLQAAATAAEQEQHQQHDDDDQQQCAEPHLASLRVERRPTRPAGRLTNQTGGHG
jgi:Histidine kinase-, DNA gyrase B-, and HSP90-like ATPase